MYYDSGNEPVEALGRYARRVGSGGALYIGGGVGVEKVGTPKGDRYALTRADAKAGEQFAGPLSAVMRAFATAGASTAQDSPGGSTKVSDPAAAARLHELRDMERQTKKDIDRVQARLAAKVPVPAMGIPSANAVDESSYEARRLAELKRDLAQIQSERTQLTTTGKVEEVEQVRPGTNFTKIPAQNVKRLAPIIKHYKGMAHPFASCVRDQIKHGLSQDHANRRCAVVKDLGEGTTKWRKGGKMKEEAELTRVVTEARERFEMVEDTLGAGAAVELAAAPASGNRTMDAIGEAAFHDLTILALSGDPFGALWEAVLGGTEFPDPLAESFTERLHPRAHAGPHPGEFVKSLAATVSLRKPNRPVEGSGPRKPEGRLRIGDVPNVPRAPGSGPEGMRAREQKGVPQHKLKTEQLPKAVGTGSWNKAVPGAMEALRTQPDYVDANGETRPYDTEKHYRLNGGAGPYTPERIELHARILKALFQGAGAHPGDKQAIFLAGGPASGKSTLLKLGVVKVPSDAVDINPDLIKPMLPEYAKLVAAGDPRASSRVHEESAHIAKWAMNLAMAREHHVVVDGVGNSGKGKFAKKIRASADNGYNTSVHYATIPTDQALARAKKRAEDPKSDSYGRNVPTGYIRSSHASVSARFRDEISNLDGITVRVYDTQAKKPRLIFEKYPSNAPKVHDKKRHTQFVAKGDVSG